MKIDGACHCGRIRYEAEIDASRVMICHCTDCQTLSGTAFRTVVRTVPGTFGFVAGTPRIYVKTAESGNLRDQAFCGDCGTPIYSAATGSGAHVVMLRVGSIRQRDDLVPSVQMFFRSARTWVADMASIPCHDGQADFSGPGGTSR